MVVSGIGGLLYRRKRRNQARARALAAALSLKTDHVEPKIPKEVVIKTYNEEAGSWPAAKFQQPRQSEITGMSGVRRWLPGAAKDAEPPSPSSTLHSHSGLTAPDSLKTKAQWSQDDFDDDEELEKRLSQARYGETPRMPRNADSLQPVSVAGTPKKTGAVVEGGDEEAGPKLPAPADTAKPSAAGSRTSQWYYLY